MKGDSSDSKRSMVVEGSRGDSTTVEWLVTGRAKRSSAGNRMTSILALEEPDSDLELLFAEDADDEGFSDFEDASSAMQMDSSSDSEDDKNGGDADDMEGERELEKQTKQQRKRRANESIPAKFRKKVRISDQQPPKAQECDRSAPRARKKSDRTSWLPAVTDLPTRASARQTTIMSKEQLHIQMMEREAKRLKQVEAMERKAKQMVDVKKPPLTQAQRMAQAVIVEKRNSRSVNRWEEAEKAREEERRGKLAALSNHTLGRPVVSFWSGTGVWEGNESGGKTVSIEERPRKRKEWRDKGHKGTSPTDYKALISGAAATTGSNSTSAANACTDNAAMLMPTRSGTAQPGARVFEGADASAEHLGGSRAMRLPVAALSTAQDSVLARPNCQPTTLGLIPVSPQSMDASLPAVATPSSGPAFQGLKAPVLRPPVLAPPPGGIHLADPSMTPMSNVLAPPNAIQRPPLSPQWTSRSKGHTHANPAFPDQHRVVSTVQPPEPETTLPTDNSLECHIPRPPSYSVANLGAEQTTTDTHPTDPSTGSKTTRHAIILRDFDETLIRDKTNQLKVLFGQPKFSKLPKPSPAPLCVITNHPARYRDPRTGLPYFNSYAYREIQRLRRGDYRFSALIGAWVGSGSYAAKGVPERFLRGLRTGGRHDEEGHG